MCCCYKSTRSSRTSLLLGMPLSSACVRTSPTGTHTTCSGLCVHQVSDWTYVLFVGLASRLQLVVHAQLPLVTGPVSHRAVPVCDLFQHPIQLRGHSCFVGPRLAPPARPGHRGVNSTWRGAMEPALGLPMAMYAPMRQPCFDAVSLLRRTSFSAPVVPACMHACMVVPMRYHARWPAFGGVWVRIRGSFK